MCPLSLVNATTIESAYQTTLKALLDERQPEGYWVGELSTSALSTATAIMALCQVRNATTKFGHFDKLIQNGLQWLAHHQNEDGGWGDTIVSFSNISTTMLCRAAIHLTAATESHASTLKRAEDWVTERYGATPEEQAEAVRQRYGKDRTFAVPILTTCALAKMVSWKEVPSLPFELACFPQSWFRFLRLHVVSYALPALIAIGQCVHYHRKPWNPLARLVRWLSIPRSLKVLKQIQPSNGGYLEATPLTSFVTLSLASIGQAEHPVVQKAVDFLIHSVREDGSWPIDTNLSTWVTTLSINALASAGELTHLDDLAKVKQWLLDQQYIQRHPYTGADPGAWAWTPLPGGVPDADDTPGAMLALCHLPESPTWTRSDLAKKWLLDLQNSDGGWPTFCRGWGHLPFDRSGSDLTAHVLRALFALEQDARHSSIESGFNYLSNQQREDGSWLPLWFGNQHSPQDENPVYGTTRVLAAFRDLDRMKSEQAQRGIRFLLAVQNNDGGWGGALNCPSSIEETALVIEILLDVGDEAKDAVNNGLNWLVHQITSGGLANLTPIGFYFAKLWYYEKLYPVIFSVAALGRARKRFSTTSSK